MISASSYKTDQFQNGSFFKNGMGVVFSGYDPAVIFNHHGIGIEAQILQKIDKPDIIVNQPFFPITDDLHHFFLAAKGNQSGPPAARIPLLGAKMIIS
jgi:hypothetical protein